MQHFSRRRLFKYKDKDMDNLNKYMYLIKLKMSWQWYKLLTMINFTFCHNVSNNVFRSGNKTQLYV